MDTFCVALCKSKSRHQAMNGLFPEVRELKVQGYALAATELMRLSIQAGTPGCIWPTPGEGSVPHRQRWQV